MSEPEEKALPRIAKDIILGVVGGIVIDATTSYFHIEFIYPALPYIWFGIVGFVTLDGIRSSKKLEAKAVGTYKRLNKRQQMISYIVVGIIGLLVAESYWFGIKKVFALRNGTSENQEHQQNTKVAPFNPHKSTDGSPEPYWDSASGEHGNWICPKGWQPSGGWHEDGTPIDSTRGVGCISLPSERKTENHPVTPAITPAKHKTELGNIKADGNLGCGVDIQGNPDLGIGSIEANNNGASGVSVDGKCTPADPKAVWGEPYTEQQIKDLDAQIAVIKAENEAAWESLDPEVRRQKEGQQERLAAYAHDSATHNTKRIPDLIEQLKALK